LWFGVGVVCDGFTSAPQKTMDFFDSADLDREDTERKHDVGDNTNPPIVFLHGWLDSWKSWSLILKNLNQPTTRLIAVTLRGWGDSEKAGAYSIDSYSSDLIQFLESKNIHQCVLCGHSMGTLISTLIAAKKPSLIKGLILCGAASKMSPDHVLDPSTSLTLSALNLLILETFPDGEISKEGENFLDSFQCDDLRPLIQNGQLPEEFMVQVLQETLKATPRSYREAFQDMIDEDHTSLLGAITCPVLIIWGTKDIVFDHLEQTKLQSLLTNSPHVMFREVDEAPHGVIWTHSQQCAEIIQEWYRGQTEFWSS
jgi:non-heme chloroperoxidase